MGRELQDRDHQTSRKGIFSFAPKIATPRTIIAHLLVIADLPRVRKSSLLAKNPPFILEAA